ncbi:MAG: metallophosphoesterase [Clostridia bacterium]|nr:metallophosphoesterase [Clostridia bacterium]MDR3644020.1 metallophosphoesterase [Clostridia bacterium]
MRIVVVSDTHRDASAFEQVVLAQPAAELFIHLGDCEREAGEIAELFPEKKFLTVAGNSDFCSQLPLQGIVEVCGKTIFYTHGHLYHVKYGLGELIRNARSCGADIALFGHTHIPVTSYEDGLYLMNPGSLGHPKSGGPTYGVIDITGAGIVTNIVEV